MITNLLIAIVALQLNPVLASLFRAVGLLPGLLIIKCAFVALLLWAAPVLHTAVLALVCAGYCWVVWHNVQVLRK